MANDFAKQYAIRLPSGELFSNSTCNIFGGHNHEPEVVVFDRRDQAEATLAMLKRQAVQLGISEWAGRIEERLCSPFSVTDPGAGFAAEVEKWAEAQGGDGQ